MFKINVNMYIQVKITTKHNLNEVHLRLFYGIRDQNSSKYFAQLYCTLLQCSAGVWGSGPDYLAE